MSAATHRLRLLRGHHALRARRWPSSTRSAANRRPKVPSSASGSSPWAPGWCSGPTALMPGARSPRSATARQLRRRAGRTRGDARARGGREPAAAADRRAGRCARRARGRGAVPDPVARARARATRCCARRGVAARRAVTEDGRPVRAHDVPLDGLVTVFPAGHPDSADGQVVLMRVDPSASTSARARDWAPNGLIGVLEGLHARRLSGRPLRGEHRAAAVPVSPVGVRRARRRPARVRARGACAAPAAARDRRRGLRRRAERLPPSRSARLTGTARERARRRRPGAARGRGRDRRRGLWRGALHRRSARARRPTASPACGG